MPIYQSIQEPSRNEIVAVGTTSVIVSDSKNTDNPRKVILIRNNSSAAADIITVNLGNNAAIASAGIVLKQYESFSDSSEAGYQCWQGSITAICATANGSLSVFER